MNTAQRVRRAGLATVAALVIGGSGVAIGAAAADSSASGTLAAATATQSPAVPGPATPGRTATPAWSGRCCPRWC
jgi:hypothetical protein